MEAVDLVWQRLIEYWQYLENYLSADPINWKAIKEVVASFSVDGFMQTWQESQFWQTLLDLWRSFEASQYWQMVVDFWYWLGVDKAIAYLGIDELWQQLNVDNIWQTASTFWSLAQTYWSQYSPQLESMLLWMIATFSAWYVESLSHTVQFLEQWPVGSTIAEALVDVGQVMEQGGLPMWVLLLCGAVLWYALLARAMTIGFFSGSPPKQRLQKRLKNPDQMAIGILASATRDAIHARQLAIDSGASVARLVNGAVMAYRHPLNRYATLIKCIIIIAPLVGLLGTVLGMIETFDALQTMALFSQSSSIAGGISQALVTTQLGLIVAIPGLLVGRLLDRRQRVIDDELDQIVNLATLGRS